MLSILLIWCYIFLLSIAYGTAFLRLVKKTKLFSDSIITIEIVSLLGLQVLVTLLCIISLVTNMGLITHVLVTIPAVAINIFLFKDILLSITNYRRNFTQNKLFWFIGILFLTIIFIQVVKDPFGYDAGMYHAQTIQWFANYKAIFGLGNLHGNLAFNSNFHLLAAFFSLSFLKLHSFQQVLGSYIILLFTLHAFPKIVHYKNITSIFYSGSLLFITIYFRDSINSPSPDISATIYILLLFSMLLEKINTNSISILDNNYAIFIFVAISLLAVKLSAICGVCGFIFIAIYCKWTYKHIYFVILIGMVCIIPWLTRNVILSGYLVYPFPAIDIFDVDWKLPLTYAMEDKNEIYYFTRYNSLYPRFVYMEESYIKSIMPDKWFSLWFSDLWWINKANFVFLCVTAFIIPTILLLSYKQKILTEKLKQLFLLWLFAWIGVLFWFINAPDFRFGYGFIFAAVLVAILLILEKISKLFTNYTSISIIIICTLFLLHSIRLEYSEYPLTNYIILPKEYAKIDVRVEMIENLPLNVPLGDYLCNIELLPCTPFPNKKLRLRGKTLEDGFKIIK